MLCRVTKSVKIHLTCVHNRICKRWHSSTWQLFVFSWTHWASDKVKHNKTSLTEIFSHFILKSLRTCDQVHQTMPKDQNRCARIPTSHVVAFVTNLQEVWPAVSWLMLSPTTSNKEKYFGDTSWAFLQIEITRPSVDQFVVWLFVLAFFAA